MRREWFMRGRRCSAWTYTNSNGGTITTVLLGALRVYLHRSARGSLDWKYHAGRRWPWWGKGSMGVCFSWRPWFVALSHNERPEDRERRLARDVAREDQFLAQRVMEMEKR